MLYVIYCVTLLLFMFLFHENHIPLNFLLSLYLEWYFVLGLWYLAARIRGNSWLKQPLRTRCTVQRSLGETYCTSSCMHPSICHTNRTHKWHLFDSCCPTATTFAVTLTCATLYLNFVHVSIALSLTYSNSFSVPDVTVDRLRLKPPFTTTSSLSARICSEYIMTNSLCGWR